MNDTNISDWTKEDIKEWRKENYLTQDEASKILCISKVEYCCLESGRHRIRTGIKKLAMYYHDSKESIKIRKKKAQK